MHAHHYRYLTLIPECLKAPFANGSDGFDCSDTIVRYEHAFNRMISSFVSDELLNGLVERHWKRCFGLYY